MKRTFNRFLLVGLCTLVYLSSATALELDGPLLQGSLLRGQTAPDTEIMLNGNKVTVTNSGNFVLGFARDAELSHSLKWRAPGQAWQSRTLTIDKREYRIQRIDGLDQNKVTPPASVLSRIRDDAKRVGQARSSMSALSGFTEQFIWPLEAPITGVYGSQRILNGKPSRPHYGIDLAAPTGTLVVAPASGKITMADPDLYYSGGTLIIDHGLGVFSTFLHMNRFDVAVGDVVEQGQKIGEVGSTGRSTGPHLDWRINWRTVRLDPGLIVPAREGLDYTSAY